MASMPPNVRHISALTRLVTMLASAWQMPSNKPADLLFRTSFTRTVTAASLAQTCLFSWLTDMLASAKQAFSSMSVLSCWSCWSGQSLACRTMCSTALMACLVNRYWLSSAAMLASAWQAELSSLAALWCFTSCTTAWTAPALLGQPSWLIVLVGMVGSNMLASAVQACAKTSVSLTHATICTKTWTTPSLVHSALLFGLLFAMLASAQQACSSSAVLSVWPFWSSS